MFGFDSSACQNCGGKCCIGESGYIFLSLHEAQDISRFLGISFEVFALKYLKKVGYRFSLIEKPFENGAACVFFDEEKRNCRIYEVRPKQCKTFPFWEGFKHKNEQDLEELFTLCAGVRRYR